MTPTTTSSTDLDALLALVVDTPPWIDEPHLDRLAEVLLLDPSAVDLTEDANRSVWAEARIMFARLRDGQCHAAVRRRAKDIAFHVRRITAQLGRCVDLPVDTAQQIRHQLRFGLLRNENRGALVGILRAAGASIEQAHAVVQVAPAEVVEAKREKTAEPKKLTWVALTRSFLNGTAEPYVLVSYGTQSVEINGPRLVDVFKTVAKANGELVTWDRFSKSEFHTLALSRDLTPGTRDRRGRQVVKKSLHDDGSFAQDGYESGGDTDGLDESLLADHNQGLGRLPGEQKFRKAGGRIKKLLAKFGTNTCEWIHEQGGARFVVK